MSYDCELKFMSSRKLKNERWPLTESSYI
jgi:hypothetical protein